MGFMKKINMFNHQGYLLADYKKQELEEKKLQRKNRVVSIIGVILCCLIILCLEMYGKNHLSKLLKISLNINKSAFVIKGSQVNEGLHTAAGAVSNSNTWLSERSHG